MITIKMYNKKWRICINEEIMEFEDRQDFESALKIILDLKDTKGRINY